MPYEPNRHDDSVKSPDKAASKSTVAEVINNVAKGGNSLLSLLSGLLAAFLILFSGYVLYDTFYTQNKAFSNSWDLLQYKPEIIEDAPSPLSGAETLATINEDYCAWLTMYETKIDYPVMQGPDDLYYANHDIYKNASLTGALYLAALNSPDFSDTYNLIYGHHMDNGAMFGALDKYTEEDYFNSHREGILITQNKIFDLYVFAAIDTDAYESEVYTVGNRDMTSLLEYIEDHAVQLDMAAAEGAEQYVAFSTCADATSYGRLVVFATMTPRNRVVIELDSYYGVYDANRHTTEARVNISEGTTVEYSIDGGRTWTSELPSIKDVGEITVYARATNSIYGTATVSAVLKVTPAQVRVIANFAEKTYNQQDPAFSARVEGVLDDFEIEYSIVRIAEGSEAPSDVKPDSTDNESEIGTQAVEYTPGAGVDEDAGYYDLVIVPYGEILQGNYTIEYIPADFEIKKSPALNVSATGYEGDYDARPHEPTAGSNVDDGNTVIEYSTDGGETWTTTPPSITEVGEKEVIVRATNPNYEDSETTVTLIVRPREVYVIADDSVKMFGDPDPVFTAQVTGVIDGYRIVYTVSRPGAGTDEEVGTYYNAIVPTGASTQGNYIVYYVPADFTITPSGKLTVVATGYEGTYDGNPHSPTATPSVSEGTKVEYSTDGGETWSTTPPSITEVGSTDVMVRATNPNYDPAYVTVTLTVNPAAVTVTADNATKKYGEDDPEFKATVSGVIDDFQIVYTVSRPGAGREEEVGEYEGAIVPTGETRQGNYIITYVNGNFEITPADTLTIVADSYEGTYDGEEHSVTAEPSVTYGTKVEYSTDGGVTWTTEPPTIKDVGEITVTVRATNPGYEPATATYTLKVNPKAVTVTADRSSKYVGSADPEFTATVDGIVDDYVIEYTVSRPGAGDDEAVGIYTGAIIPEGEEGQ